MTLERIGDLKERISVLAEDFDEEALEVDANKAKAAAVSSSPPWTIHRPHGMSKPSILSTCNDLSLQSRSRLGSVAPYRPGMPS